MTAGRLEGRKAIVTGAARGIGLAIARRLAQEGAEVMLADIDGDIAEAEARAIGGNALAARVDIASPASIDAMLDAARGRWGVLHILVNNAAILDMTAFERLTLERFNEVLAVNLTGALACTLAAVPLMSAGWSRVLNIASIMGVRGSRDSLPYSTAKGGIVNMTRALACDLAPRGILVNAIAPGFIDTRMALLPDGTGHEHETAWFKDIYLKYGRIPLGRAGTPEDIAGPALFLCSEDCRYVTGQILLVDGGVSATF
ncbi:MAG: SDR family oxidoreductase [Rhodospirillaceae bacterium]|nr:SDR family oxidoreductase [Rhodospirillaceae bacterium]